MNALGKGFPKATGLWPLVLILGVAVLGQFFYSIQKSNIPSASGSYGFGGPLEDPETNAGFFLGSSNLLAGLPTNEENYFIFDAGVILGGSHPLSSIAPTRDGLKRYKVQVGDTLSGIAARFGISVQTIRWANPGARSIIQPGEEIIVLPVSGIIYITRQGDSLEAIASRFRLDPQTIRDYNPNYQKILDQPGESLVLPYAKPLGAMSYASYAENLPNLQTYFVLPAMGWNWGRLHDYNAVDIADQCGKPIYVAAEGLVIEESSEGFWNQGYGNYVMVEHPNGTKTRYAHTGKNLVKVGDYVTQGDEIALIGNTGNTHGPTGCHLHFEVYGARNSFAVR